MAQAVQQQSNNAFLAELDQYTPYLRDALPAHIPVERFKRVVVTAVAGNPDLLYANRRSLITSCQRCAVDGLLPDGREAALVVYNTRVKQRDPQTGLDREVRMDLVQYMPMIAGIRKRLRNTGEVASAVAEAVHAKDTFRYSLGDNAFIDHAPPPLGEDRGDVIGAYAIIRLSNGEVIRDVMDRAAIERARGQSRAKDSLMWKTFYGEGAKKTVLRRAAKQAPFSPDIERLFDRDEQPAVEAGAERLPPDTIDHGEPEPQRPIEPRLTQQPAGPQFAVVDLDGVENVFAAGSDAVEALHALMGDARRMGSARLQGWWESNQPVIDLLSATGFDQQATDLAIEYADAMQPPPPAPAGAAQTREAPAPTQPQPEPQTGPTGGPPRLDLTIPMVMKQGKPDYRAWAVALFIPKLRRMQDNQSLAFLLGDNAEHLERARGELGRDELTTLNASIDQQWKQVGNAAA